MCSGYYSYKQGHMPQWPGMEDFAGRLVHPQQWPQDLDYANKRVVVIGSGATAVTLIPAMADETAHVTMLQRSPSYIAARPSEDKVANWLARRFPDKMARWLTRWKYILEGIYYYQLARRFPETTRRTMLNFVQRALGPDYDVETHFSPTYNPWDQRVCLVPDGDLFKAIRSGKASVVTDHIDSFSETGIRLRSGATLEADLVVSATGLTVQLMGGMEIVVDGRPVALAETMSYKGMMFSGVPNLASAFGYTNSSWTLKCELIAQYVCRLLNTHAAPRLRPMHPTPRGSRAQRAPRRRLDLRLHPARGQCAASAERQKAVEDQPELPARPGGLADQQRGR